MTVPTIQDLLNSVISHRHKEAEKRDHSTKYQLFYHKENTMEIEQYQQQFRSAHEVIISSVVFPIIAKKIVHGENSWALRKLKVKNADEEQVSKMLSMLNKITDKTCEKFAVFSKENLEYESPEIIALIFKKIVQEPVNTELYFNFCEKLYDMSIFSEICFDQFASSKEQLGLTKFISVLYNRGIIIDLQSYIDLILETEDAEITNDNIFVLTTLLKHIITLNKKTSKSIEVFKDVVGELMSNKTEYNSKCRCMILDLNDLIVGKRV